MTKANASRDVWLAIGEVASRTGLSVPTIRFYESRQLINSIRTAGGQRRFKRADIRRLSFIMIAQQLGFSLGAIGELLDKLPEGRTPTQSDWEKLGRYFRDDINARIASLERLRDGLSSCIGCGCLSLKRCHLYNPDDVAAREGPGPRRLMDT